MIINNDSTNISELSYPSVSIIMVDGQFRESFHGVDYFTKQNYPTDNLEVIWVEYYKEAASEVVDAFAGYPNSQIVTLGREGTYHSSYCFNEGIRRAHGEVLIIPDADVVVTPDVVETIVAEHRRNPKLAMYVRRFDQVKEDFRSDASFDHLERTCHLRNPTNYGGCLTVRRRWLEAINGYERHPVFSTGLHANGMDVMVRFRNLGLDILWHPTLKLYHPWHPMTETFGDIYRLQHIVIRHRELTLSTQAFSGLDSRQSTPMPEELLSSLRAEMNSRGIVIPDGLHAV